VRICKKLGIDYAEAVTGFEFGSKMAVPVIQGVVIAEENEELLRDAWRADAAEKRKREELKAEKRILQTWRKFLFGLRIMERVREEYGGGDPEAGRERDAHNPFVLKKRKKEDEEKDEGEGEEGDHHDPESEYDPMDYGGGFLLPGEDDADDGLIVEHHEQQAQAGPSQTHVDSDGDRASERLSPPISVPSASDNEEHDDDSEDAAPEYTPRPTRRTARR
jgi:xeroderma pigmentosum group C-complementing protein